jgi:hypothetical protein
LPGHSFDKDGSETFLMSCDVQQLRGSAGHVD